MKTAYAAYIQTELPQGLVTLRVFPRSKKTTLFDSVAAAEKMLNAKRIAGRGLIIPSGVNEGDADYWSRVIPVSL